MREATERGDVSPIVSNDMPDPSASDARLQMMRMWITLALPQQPGNIHDPAGQFDPNDPSLLRRQEAAEDIQSRRLDGGSVW